MLLLGSIREGRKSDRVAAYLLKRLTEMPGVTPSLVDLLEVEVPMFDSRWQKVADPDPVLVSLGAELAAADGMIFISPEYHGSYTGVLKNCVDHYWKEFARKPIGVVSTGSGRMAGINGSIQMQHLVLSLGAYAMPFKFLVPYVHETFNEQGKILDEKVAEGAEKFLKEYVWFTKAIVAAKRLELA